ncbi:Rieske (2Fe-2S) protein [Pleurocapsa sp. PCC 7319]|uniref:Rieske (2Fe-2S) protein n=1 Tax=Pleurocapsa sp. PCC 7319 TaxID=118161 RepID=UPI000367EB03|nr:Rieske (2Fe-2S) protein [Pleurocapsa sp. PCC 7319]
MHPVLPGAPWLIAHKSMLSVNRPHKITLNGRDYVLWKNSKGEVFALDNTCPHMQAPLSEGWVCAERNTITCPFHALEFDGEGRLYRDRKPSAEALAHSLELNLVGDCVWTYGGCESRLPIPDVIERRSQGFRFVGMTGHQSVWGDFLSNLLISYDYNHFKGTHRELFKIQAIEIHNYEANDYKIKLDQKIIRQRNSSQELLINPLLGIFPQIYLNRFEYSFPSLVTLIGEFPVGKVLQVLVIYPETENRTKTFTLVYAQSNPILLAVLKKFLLRSVAELVRQDIVAVENLYPRQPPKIKLPDEEIMFYAEKLYRNWR